MPRRRTRSRARFEYATAPAIGWPSPFVRKLSSSSTKSSETRLPKKFSAVTAEPLEPYREWPQYQTP